MITDSMRIKSLKGFPPIEIGEFNSGSKHLRAIFVPCYNTIQIFDKDDDIPISVTFQTLKAGILHSLSNNDHCSTIIESLFGFWKSMPKSKKNQIIDSMPINSLYIGGDKVY